MKGRERERERGVGKWVRERGGGSSVWWRVGALRCRMKDRIRQRQDEQKWFCFTHEVPCHWKQWFLKIFDFLPDKFIFLCVYRWHLSTLPLVLMIYGWKGNLNFSIVQRCYFQREWWCFFWCLLKLWCSWYLAPTIPTVTIDGCAIGRTVSMDTMSTTGAMWDQVRWCTSPSKIQVNSRVKVNGHVQICSPFCWVRILSF